jgi:hypothetical protein
MSRIVSRICAAANLHKKSTDFVCLLLYNAARSFSGAHLMNSRMMVIFCGGMYV